ncbi:uncharacterized protein LOC121242550 [Juglans microcarpa x Juglans regia]|uniref:uncharacterized protein LOC121242550 n=1 Tax=Juglans microcarpa x Juglans regia TaxID=2249226 RepID=UPI001B7DF403|nr:uncharacterized protein LOC121242550 [Juglans microcarpa x Juglans regia]
MIVGVSSPFGEGEVLGQIYEAALVTVVKSLPSNQTQKILISVEEVMGASNEVFFVSGVEEVDSIMAGVDSVVGKEIRPIGEGTSLLSLFVDSEGSEEEEMGSPSPLQMLPPHIAPQALDWVLKKVEELCGWVGLSCDDYKDQFMALLVAMEAGRSTVMKSAVRKERELKRLQYYINYDNKEGTSGRDRAKGRDTSFVNEA